MTERRYFGGAELRTESVKGQVFLQGKALSYEIKSHFMGWYEILKRGCFDEVMASKDLDVVHLYNHDQNLVLGRSTSGTTVLKNNSQGLYYRTVLADTTFARDLAEMVKRGDVNESSFCFSIAEDVWTYEPDPDDPGYTYALRTVVKAGGLYDVATCNRGAFPKTNATVADRDLPEGMPRELRDRILEHGLVGQGQRASKPKTRSTNCECDCPSCDEAMSSVSGCIQCSNPECEDDECRENGCPVQQDLADRAARQARLRVAQADW